VDPQKKENEQITLGKGGPGKVDDWKDKKRLKKNREVVVEGEK